MHLVLYTRGDSRLRGNEPQGKRKLIAAKARERRYALMMIIRADKALDPDFVNLCFLFFVFVVFFFFSFCFSAAPTLHTDGRDRVCVAS